MTRMGKPRFVIRRRHFGDWWVLCTSNAESSWVCPASMWLHYLGEGVWRNYK